MNTVFRHVALCATLSFFALGASAQQTAGTSVRQGPAVLNKNLPCTLAGSDPAADMVEQAATCVRDGKMIEAAKLYQAGLLRLRILAEMEKSDGHHRGLLSEYQKRLGPVILNWAGGDVRDLIDSLEWAMRFDKTVPDFEIQAYAKKMRVSDAILRGIRAEQYSNMLATRKKVALEMEEVYDKRHKNGTGVRDVAWRAKKNMKPEGWTE